MTEDLILKKLGHEGQKELVEGVVNGKTVKTIPDFIDRVNGVLGEVKDVAHLGWESQIEAQYNYAVSEGLTYIIYIRSYDVLQGELKRLVDAGKIQYKLIDEVLK